MGFWKPWRPPIPLLPCPPPLPISEGRDACVGLQYKLTPTRSQVGSCMAFLALLDACLGPQLESKPAPTRSQVGSTFAQDGFQEPHQSVYTAALQNIVPVHVLLGFLGALGLPCCHRPQEANLKLRYFYICHKKFGAEPQKGKIQLVVHKSLVQNLKRSIKLIFPKSSTQEPKRAK